MSYTCPLCHAPLSRSENQLYSARSGTSSIWRRKGMSIYCRCSSNVRAIPGDSAEMMQAPPRLPRRRTLSAAAGVRSLQRSASISRRASCWISAAARGTTRMRSPPSPARSCGLDVSKPAIRAAAKRYPQVEFCVASSQRLPFCRSVSGRGGAYLCAL